MENVAHDIAARESQTFRMAAKPDPYAQECGARLERVRKALGYDSRASLAKFMFDPDNEEELRREADNIRKYESGILPPPRFVTRMEELTGKEGVMEYVYKGSPGKLDPDLSMKVRRAERESAR